MRQSLPVEQRAVEWIDRLRTHASARLPAADLYSGEHWHTIRSVLASVPRSHRSVRIWVCSAGYGLVPLDTPLSPYSATFTPGDEDAVSTAAQLRTALPRWWAAVAEYDGVHRGPRTIAGIVRTHPDDFLLVVLPKTYVTAVADDLRATVRAARSREQFAVLSVGGRVPPEVDPHRLPASASLQGLVGGSLCALNARLARFLVADVAAGPLTLTRCRRKLLESLKNATPARPDSRTAQTDDEIRTVAHSFLKENPQATPGPLLRRLRDSGRACSYSRFVTLFRQAKEATGARA